MFWLENSSTEKNLYIRSLRMSWNGGSTNFNRPLFIRVEVGTTQPTTNTTTGTVNNTNLNSAAVSESTVLYWNETGAGMTGHAVGTTWRYLIQNIGANKIDFDGVYIIGPTNTIGIYATGNEIGELSFSWGFVESELLWGL